MADLTCDEFRVSGAELALGVLYGRERADALAHVEGCAACQREMVSMGEVADRLVELTPAAEPPAGFETRVLARLAASRGPAARRRRTVPGAARIAVAAALAVAIGVGGWAVGRSGGHAAPRAGGYVTPPTKLAPPTGGAGEVRTASFVAGGRRVGQAAAFGGRHPWLAVALDSNLGDRTIICQLVERNGAVITVGSYLLRHGDGSWGSAIGVAASSVARVQLIDSSGAAVATAAF